MIFANYTLKAKDRSLVNRKAIVKSGAYARFSTLTPQTVRMEWDGTGTFNDYSSFIVVNQDLPVSSFIRTVADGWLTIKTRAIEICQLQFVSTKCQVPSLSKTWSAAAEALAGPLQRNSARRIVYL